MILSLNNAPLYAIIVLWWHPFAESRKYILDYKMPCNYSMSQNCPKIYGPQIANPQIANTQIAEGPQIWKKILSRKFTDLRNLFADRPPLCSTKNL